MATAKQVARIPAVEPVGPSLESGGGMPSLEQGQQDAGADLFAGDVMALIAVMRGGQVRGDRIPMLAARLGISQDYLLTQLRLPKSTMASRIARNGTLSAVEQDRIYRVERVLWRSQQVFEDAAAAVAWINRSNRALGGVAPLTLLDTEAGYELVLDTLGRIEYGVFS